jgi:hypothetical protein
VQLTEHFSLSEFMVSETAYRLDIDMAPPPEVVANLMMLCEQVLEPLRELINEQRPGGSKERFIIVTSGYRPPALNRAIGGSKTSAHMDGRAADCHATGMSIRDFAEHAEAISRRTPVDQVILEFGRWVHIGMSRDPRRQVLTALRHEGQTVYELGLV